MANMSYCRFQNTLQDLRDCYYNMSDSLTGAEFHAREGLIELCKSIGEEFHDGSRCGVCNHTRADFKSRRLCVGLIGHFSYTIYFSLKVNN